MTTQAAFFDERDAEYLFDAMRDCRSFLKCHGITETNARVQASAGGSWSLHTGSSDYDTDHSGYWGAGSIAADDDDKTLGKTLASMVDQACDQASESDASGAKGIGLPETVEIHAICRHVAN